MLHSDYPLQALLYVVVVHRYLRWRQPGYDPAQHLGGVLYLYVRGMCGPDTPDVDGHPAGVFSWRPPAALVVALSDLLDGLRDGVSMTLRPSSSRTRTTRGWPAAPSACCGPSTRPVCSTPPTSTWPSVCAPWPARTTSRSRSRWRSWSAPCAAARCASTWPLWPERRRVDLPWPDADAWSAALAASPLVTADPPVLRLLEHGGVRLLYLDRYWREEEQVARRPRRPPAGSATPSTRPGWPRRSTASSRARATTSSAPPPGRAAPTATTVLTGGPGTGKTTTVAGLLALLRRAGRARRRAALRIALAAPTGKAAARLQQAVQAEVATLRRGRPRARWPASARSTMHRLLGRDPDTSHPVPPRPRQPAARTTWSWSTRPRWSR